MRVEKKRCLLWFVLVVSLLRQDAAPAKGKNEAGASWKVGVAKVVITPEEPIWMAGYASRNKPSEGKIQDLYAKALVLEDPAGRRLVILTTDLIGFSRSIAEKVAQEVQKRTGLKRDRLMLTSSHTHTGPVIRDSLIDMYNLSTEQAGAVSRYTARLEQEVVRVVEEALRNLAPARISYGVGQAEFAVNRRLPSPTGYKIAVNPDGPVDHTVPVLRIDDSNGALRAVLLGYACHNTTLTGEFYQFSGDYAGFAQSELEQQYPGALTLFVTGCGADANPNPRSTLELAQQHGRSLAAAVSQVLSQPLTAVAGNLAIRWEVIPLPLVVPTRDEFQKRLEETDIYRQRHARRMLKILDEQGKIPDRYPYPIQVCRLGSDLTLVALAGEVVVDYALRLKRDLKLKSLWTIAYANDVFAYIPSVRVLREGGYEAYQSGIYYGMPGPFAEPAEELIVGKVKAMAAKVQAR
jgi:Neutral/alkaline non-lysosomal ceramidase, N-terminal